MKHDIGDQELMALLQAIVDGDEITTFPLLSASPGLAKARLADGATRQNARAYFFDAIGHHLYAGDTALHAAAAAYRIKIALKLIKLGADVRAKNRRGAEPLHYAVDGRPGSPAWHPQAQAATIACLLQAGADPNCTDQGGVTPLLRAVRNRCAAAVAALVDGGADVHRTNKNGSTAWQLATVNSGRGGSGSPEAKQQQQIIAALLAEHGAHTP